MLPYTPLHHLLFAARRAAAAGHDQRQPLERADRLRGRRRARRACAGIADAFLVGERPIARRVDDSVVRVGRVRPDHPAPRPRLRARRGRDAARRSTGARARRRSQEHASRWWSTARRSSASTSATSTTSGRLRAFQATIRDLMRDVRRAVATTCWSRATRTRISLDRVGASSCRPRPCTPVQHHRAHIASVLAEREAWDTARRRRELRRHRLRRRRQHLGRRVLRRQRARRLRPRRAPAPGALAGGDAAARHPVQAAAGFPRAARRPARPDPRPVRLSAALHAGVGAAARRRAAVGAAPRWAGCSTPSPRCSASPGR